MKQQETTAALEYDGMAYKRSRKRDEQKSRKKGADRNGFSSAAAFFVGEDGVRTQQFTGVTNTSEYRYVFQTPS
jgi:hypothetical protein